MEDREELIMGFWIGLIISLFIYGMGFAVLNITDSISTQDCYINFETGKEICYPIEDSSDTAFLYGFMTIIFLLGCVISFVSDYNGVARLIGWVIGYITTITLISAFKNFFIKWWIFIIIVIILGEAYYWFIDKKKPKKRCKLMFVIERKSLALLISTAFTISLIGLINISKKIIPFFRQHLQIIIKWLGYIGITIICLVIILAILYGYVKLNSLKYKD